MRPLRRIRPCKSTAWLALIVLTMVPACEKSDTHPTTKPAPPEIRIGYLPYSSGLSFFVAQEQGYFREANLTIRPKKCASSNEAMNALRAGELDFIMGVGLSTFFAVEGAAPGSFKCFQPCVEDSAHHVSYLLIPKDSSLSEVTQLKGKRVGTYSGTSQVLVLRLLLRKLGFNANDSSDVRIGAVASRLQIDALAAGQFDAFLMLEPYATKAMMLHGAKPLVTSPRTQYILDPFPAGANAVSRDFLASHPQLTEKVVAALDQAIESIHADEAAAKATLPRFDKTLTPEIARATSIYRWWKRSETDISAVQQYADLLYDGQALKSRVKVASMFLD